MKKVMLLATDQNLITKVKQEYSNVLVYSNFMDIFEQLNFHNPNVIIFDFSLIKHEEQFMLESLPKKHEEHYIELIAIGSNFTKEKMADFVAKIN